MWLPPPPKNSSTIERSRTYDLPAARAAALAAKSCERERPPRPSTPARTKSRRESPLQSRDVLVWRISIIRPPEELTLLGSYQTGLMNPIIIFARGRTQLAEDSPV